MPAMTNSCRTCSSSTIVSRGVRGIACIRGSARGIRPAAAATESDDGRNARVPAGLSGDQNDPRQIGDCPGHTGKVGWDTVSFVGRGLFYSLGLVYVPGVYLFRLPR